MQARGPTVSTCAESIRFALLTVLTAFDAAGYRDFLDTGSPAPFASKLIRCRPLRMLTAEHDMCTYVSHGALSKVADQRRSSPDKRKITVLENDDKFAIPCERS